jgi:hypothetical protein
MKESLTSLTYLGCLATLIIFTLLHYYAIGKIVSGIRCINKHEKIRNYKIFFMCIKDICIGIFILAFCLFCIFLYIIYIEEILGKHIN